MEIEAALTEILGDATAETRDCILRASVGVFMRYGFRKTSVGDVAAAAEISRQGLYHHFPTKEALYQGTVTWALAMNMRRVRMILAGGGEVADRVLEAFVAWHGPYLEGEGREQVTELWEELVRLAGEVVASSAEEFRGRIAGALGELDFHEDPLGVTERTEFLFLVSKGIQRAGYGPDQYRGAMGRAIALVTR